MLTKTSKNSEIIATLGNVTVPTVFATAPSSNPEYVSLFIVQERDKGMDKTNIKNMLLAKGGTTRCVRHIEQAHVESIKANGIKPGYKFTGFNISLEDVTKQPHPDAKPKMRGTDGDAVTSEGAYVYETTKLTYGEIKDSHLVYDKVEVVVATATQTAFASR